MRVMTLPTIGEVPVKAPDLLSAADVAAAWYKAELQIQLRLSAAAIGLAWDRDSGPKTDPPGPKAKPPVYASLSGEIVEYGGLVLRWLMARDVTPWELVEPGSGLVVWFSELLPSDAEVEEAEGNSGSTVTDTVND